MSEIKGVVAAGHIETANAGKQILEAGGNAVDAIIASAFAGCVAEPLLTGLGAGGYMLVHNADTKKQELSLKKILHLLRQLLLILAKSYKCSTAATHR
jgi:gamma-glutamyltranspeptidase